MGVAFGASLAATYSWRSAFVVLGAVGIITRNHGFPAGPREPVRGGLDVPSPRGAPATPT